MKRTSTRIVRAIAPARRQRDDTNGPSTTKAAANWANPISPLVVASDRPARWAISLTSSVGSSRSSNWRTIHIKPPATAYATAT